MEGHRVAVGRRQRGGRRDAPAAGRYARRVHDEHEAKAVRTLLIAVVIAGCADAAPRSIVVVPIVISPPAAAVASDAATPEQPEPTRVEPPAKRALDLASAPRVALRASPAQASAPKPIGSRPANLRTLKEKAKVLDPAPLERANARTPPYDPLRLNEIKETPPALPKGARADIPLAHAGAPLHAISQSGGKLLLVYGARYIAIAGDEKVEQILDMDPPELSLTEKERAFSDVHQVVYSEGIAYVCRGYNGWFRSRKGYVTAVDVATGEMRWRSAAQTCGGTLALIGEYVITGYGEDIMPYALKLLRRADGSSVQSIRNDGAALDFLVDGESVIVETYKHRITYELR